MKRRNLLIALCSSVAGTLGAVRFSRFYLDFGNAPGSCQRAGTDSLRKALREGIVELDSAEFVGKAVIARFENLQSASRWADRRIDIIGRIAKNHQQTSLGKIMRRSHMLDLQEGRTMFVGGWLLSHSEVLPSVIFVLDQKAQESK